MNSGDRSSIGFFVMIGISSTAGTLSASVVVGVDFVAPVAK